MQSYNNTQTLQSNICNDIHNNTQFWEGHIALWKASSLLKDFIYIYTYIYVCIYVYIYIHICIYICIYREREREKVNVNISSNSSVSLGTGDQISPICTWGMNAMQEY